MSTLIPYEPAKLINDMHNFVENLWQRTMDLDASKLTAGQWLPAIDVKEEKGRFIITADLPGVDPKDIEVAMEDDVLTLKGKREQVQEEQKGSYYRMERTKGQFYRQLTLPSTADNTKISARAKQGVLELIIPKKAVTESKKIQVKIEE